MSVNEPIMPDLSSLPEVVVNGKMIIVKGKVYLGHPNGWHRFP